jgi:hypothetical protein
MERSIRNIHYKVGNCTLKSELKSTITELTLALVSELVFFSDGGIDCMI